MRSYGQYCALARTLDVIGERWTLLIIRELFARDCRYSDLREALPGIATNLLAERLRHLQEHGVIEAYDVASPVRATVYRLTDRGLRLAPALVELVSWGAALVDEQGDDDFRTHWMALGLPTFFRDVSVADLAPLEVRVVTGDQPATLRVTDDGVAMDVAGPGPPRAGTGSRAADDVDVDAVEDDWGPHAVTVEGAPDAVFAFLTGRARPAGQNDVRVRGASDAVRRVRALASRAGSG